MLLKNILVFILLLCVSAATAQISQLTSRNTLKANSLTFLISYGEIIQRDAWFWGLSGEYSKRINNLPIGVAGAIMWDQETTRGDKPKMVGTFTTAITGCYLINHLFSVGTGISKGFMDDDNPQKTYKFSDGDWSTGIFGAYQFKKGVFGNPLSVSASFEYNISQNETSISVDLAYGFTF